MATLYPSLKIVTRPSDTGSTVLADLADDAPPSSAAPRKILAGGFSLGAPELEGDPDAIDPLYGNRTIEATLEVTGTKAQAFAFISSLSRVLVTGYTGGFIPGLWLRYQVTSTSTPYWFRLLRPNPALLNWDAVYTKTGGPQDVWRLDMDLPAEAFAYGARETVALQTLSNNPTAATNPCRLDLGTIKGDAPAPLTIESISDQAGAAPFGGMIVMHAATTTPLAYGIDVGTGDGLTAGTDMSAGAADALAVGGSKRTVSFATNTAMVTRLSGSTGAMRSGTYKILARVGVTDSSLYLRMSLTTFPATPAGQVTWCGTAGDAPERWVDLGNFNIGSASSRDGLYSDSATPLGPFALAASRTSGASSLTVDYLLFIPIKQRSATVECRVLYPWLVRSNTYTYVVEGDTEENLALFGTSSGSIDGNSDWSVPGVYPRVVPGVVNTLWMVNQVVAGDSTGGGNVVANTASVVCKYYPRYLNVPAT